MNNFTSDIFDDDIFVTFKTAKVLKNNGYPYICDSFYDNNGYIHALKEPGDIDGYIPRPMLEHVRKWLYESNIVITIEQGRNGTMFHGYICCPQDQKETVCFTNYYLAYNVAISEALRYLKK